MEQYIIVYSKYVITFLMILYTVLSLVRVFSSPGRRKPCDNVQSVLVFLVQFAAFLTICVEKGSVDYLFYYAFAQLVLFASEAMFLMLYPGIDRLICNNMCMLLGCGFIILVRLDLSKAVRQLLIAGVSMALAMAVVLIVRRCGKILKHLSVVYAGLGIAALSVVLILGQVTHGSRISFSIGGITFQPSEFVKILFVFFLAAFLWKNYSFKNVVISAVIAGIHVLVLVLSRDLGSALIFFAAYVFVVFFATGKIRYLCLGAAGGTAAAYVAYRVFSHVQVRVQAWKDPWSVIDDQGYQITQSLFALSRGGWFGLGIGQGTPKDIPYVETDFVFAAVTEEMGILFSVCLILVCVSCFLMFLRIAAAQRDRFYALLASGLGVMYVFQIFLTIGGGTKFIPLTGVTLPLVSYGGSSVMSTLLLFAIVQGACLRQQDELEKERRRRRGVEDDEEDEEWYKEEWEDEEMPEDGRENDEEDWPEDDEEEYEAEYEEDYSNSPEAEIIWEETDY